MHGPCRQGQFTRFQRAFHITPFRLLLRHRQSECLSSLQVGRAGLSLGHSGKILMHFDGILGCCSIVRHVEVQTMLCRYAGVRVLPAWQVSEREFRQRVLVTGVTNEEAIFEITMLQRFGGLYDGVYYTRSLKAESPCAQGV